MEKTRPIKPNDQPAWKKYYAPHESEIKGFKQIPDAILEEMVLPLVPAGGSILDTGCGISRVLEKLQYRGYRLAGLDYVSRTLELTARKCPDAELFLVDLRYENIPGTYDLIIMNLCLPFLIDGRHQYQPRVIKKIREHCRLFLLAAHVLLPPEIFQRDYATQMLALGTPVRQLHYWLRCAFGNLTVMHHRYEKVKDKRTGEMRDCDIFTYLAQ